MTTEELRDTFALEIAKIILEQNRFESVQDAAKALAYSYGLADAALSHRNVSAPEITKNEKEKQA